MFSFTEQEFEAQVVKSKGWGEPTSGLLDMMEEMIVAEARNADCKSGEKTAMVESSLVDFESGNLLIGLIHSAPIGQGYVVDHFQSSICCTFKHFLRKHS